MSENANKAVFLSYASQDAEAARRICDALRSGGVEVWFDADGGLEHGDEWDAKIRRQIKECVLFLPVISANTQARHEGYFRIEWELAAQRAMGVASGVPFILPVVIDDTREPDALVPDRFRMVQWTRLPGGVVTPEVKARYLKLWSHRAGVLSHVEARAVESSTRAPFREPVVEPVPPRRKRPVLLTAAAIAALGAASWWMLNGPAEKSSTPVRNAVVATETAAQQLVTKALSVFEAGDELNRETSAFADDMLKKAEALDPTEASAWALHARVSAHMIKYGLDSSPARRDALRLEADRAAKLAPDSLGAGLAAGLVKLWLVGDTEGTQILLSELAKKFPNDWHVLQVLAFSYYRGAQQESAVGGPQQELAMVTARRALELEPDNPALKSDLVQVLMNSQPLDEIEGVIRHGLEGRTGIRLLCSDVWTKLFYRGNLAGAFETMQHWPTSLLLEDRGVALAGWTNLWHGDSAKALQLVRQFPRDYIRDTYFLGPSAVIAALANDSAGNTEAARGEWQTVLQLTDRELKANPIQYQALHWKAWALARLGDTAAAQLIMGKLAGKQIPQDIGYLVGGLGGLALTLGQKDKALANLEIQFRPWASGRLKRHQPSLAINPFFTSLHSDPRFQALVAVKSALGTDGENVSPVAAKPDEKSVAVLAFANLSDDKTNEYFSDGISEELLNVLAKIPGLKVTARTSAFFFKGKNLPIPEIAKQLGVAYVVEGSVRKAGSQVRITAQLIKAEDGFHVWSDTFTRELKDIFAVQDEIAGLIAKNLELKMGMTPARPTIDVEAYQEYLAGRAAATKGRMSDLHEAVTHLERAVAMEPKFTAAWVQLASAHTRLGRWGGTPTQQAWPAARAAIARAQALEPDSPDVLLALGWVRRTADWDWRGAEQAFRRSLQLQPNQPDALAGAAVLLFNIGQTEEAFRLGQQAAQLDPLNAAAQQDLSLMFYFNHNWAESERSARRALQLAPNGNYHGSLSWSLTRQKRYAEAEAEVRLESDELEQAVALAVLAMSRGPEAALRDCRARFEAIAQKRGSDTADLQVVSAYLDVALGDKNRAFAALEKARASHDPATAWLRNDDHLAPLRSDPRWNVLLHQIGLADDQLK